MKALQKLYIKMVLSVLACFASLAAFAQDDTKKIEVDINTKGGESAGNFFMQPWVWVVGGAIFILLLVALLRGNRRSD